MLHHISIGVRDLSQSTKFYDSVLSVLGYRRYMSKPGTESWKKSENGIAFWINQRANLSVVEDSGNHIAFQANSCLEVDDFHSRAIKAGASDDGSPGFRPEYKDTYYAAFICALDGHKLEAVHITN